MKAGAVEFLTKPFRTEYFLKAVAAAVERDRLALAGRCEIEHLRRRYEKLTSREREVLALIVAGLLNKQIAGKIDTTERTIKFHRATSCKRWK